MTDLELMKAELAAIQAELDAVEKPCYTKTEKVLGFIIMLPFIPLFFGAILAAWLVGCFLRAVGLQRQAPPTEAPQAHTGQQQRADNFPTIRRHG